MFMIFNQNEIHIESGVPVCGEESEAEDGDFFVVAGPADIDEAPELEPAW